MYVLIPISLYTYILYPISSSINRIHQLGQPPPIPLKVHAHLDHPHPGPPHHQNPPALILNASQSPSQLLQSFLLPRQTSLPNPQLFEGVDVFEVLVERLGVLFEGVLVPGEVLGF
jgi:hypothetical protein